MNEGTGPHRWLGDFGRSPPRQTLIALLRVRFFVAVRVPAARARLCGLTLTFRLVRYGWERLPGLEPGPRAIGIIPGGVWWP